MLDERVQQKGSRMEMSTCARVVQLPVVPQFIVSHSSTGNFGPALRSSPCKVGGRQKCERSV